MTVNYLPSIIPVMSAPNQDLSRSDRIFISSSSLFGTVTNLGTVTAFSFRNAWLRVSISSPKRRTFKILVSDRRSHPKGPPPARVGKRPPAPLGRRARQPPQGEERDHGHREAHLAHRPLGQLVVPPVLHLVDLPVLAHVDAHHRVDRLLLLDPLEPVLVGQVQLDRVPARRDAVALDLDRAEHGRQPVPLRRELVEPRGDGERVREGGAARPERQVLERGVAFEELRAVAECR